MAIEALGGVTSATTASASQTTVSQNDLINIMLAELKYQDPLKPLDNRDFIAQLAQFTTLEQTKELNDRIDTLLSVQASTQSVGLIGREIDVTAPTGGTVTGKVTTITFEGGVPKLSISPTDGSSPVIGISLADVQQVR